MSATKILLRYPVHGQRLIQWRVLSTLGTTGASCILSTLTACLRVKSSYKTHPSDHISLEKFINKIINTWGCNNVFRTVTYSGFRTMNGFLINNLQLVQRG